MSDSLHFVSAAAWQGVMFKVPLMKYLLVVPIILGVFYAGVYYENKRLVGEPDTTIAILLSSLAIDNSQYQLRLNSEYLELIEKGDTVTLKEKIESNNHLLTGIKNDAESVCSEVKCNKEHITYIERAKNE